jgi:hypothetical protein
LVPQRNVAITQTIIVPRRDILTLEDEAADLRHGLQALWRFLRPCRLLFEINQTILGDIIDRNFDLDHPSFVIILNYTDCFVGSHDAPSVGRVRINKLRGGRRPEANGFVVFHQVDKDVSHHLNGGVGSLIVALGKTIVPSVIR